MSASVLDVADLSVTYNGGIEAVRQVSFSIAEGECLALVGESGSGKSSIARAVLGLLPPAAHTIGSIRLRGVEVVGADPTTLHGLRGLVAGYVWQNPFEACNPLDPIFSHVSEAWRAHRDGVDEGDVANRLSHLGISEPERRMHRYPHQWSGGMLQRASIAAASARQPVLIVADEPTSALDADRADAVLQRLRQQGAAVLLVSHDAKLVARHADRVAVCYAGCIVEVAAASDIISAPHHPYTAGLVRALPSARRRLPEAMPGAPPDPKRLPPGCAFAPRCVRASTDCTIRRPQLDCGCACFHPMTGSEHLEPQPLARSDERRQSGPIILTARGLRKIYGRGRHGHLAVAEADMDIARGEIVGISGPSGCGKSTLLRLLAGIERPSGGEVERRSDGAAPVAAFTMPIFQDATGSLNARWPLWRSVSEPATAPHRSPLGRADRRSLAARLLAEVGLERVDLEARPSELSGGQCQRAAIARALAAEPTLLIADEPTSALDPSISAVILRLMRRVADAGMAIVIVSHDRLMLDALCDRVLEMRDGRLSAECGHG